MALRRGRIHCTATAFYIYGRGRESLYRSFWEIMKNCYQTLVWVPCASCILTKGMLPLSNMSEAEISYRSCIDVESYHI